MQAALELANDELPAILPWDNEVRARAAAAKSHPMFAAYWSEAKQCFGDADTAELLW